MDETVISIWWWMKSSIFFFKFKSKDKKLNRCVLPMQSNMDGVRLGFVRFGRWFGQLSVRITIEWIRRNEMIPKWDRFDFPSGSWHAFENWILAHVGRLWHFARLASQPRVTQIGPVQPAPFENRTTNSQNTPALVHLWVNTFFWLWIIWSEGIRKKKKWKEKLSSKISGVRIKWPEEQIRSNQTHCVQMPIQKWATNILITLNDDTLFPCNLFDCANKGQVCANVDDVWMIKKLWKRWTKSLARVSRFVCLFANLYGRRMNERLAGRWMIDGQLLTS